MVYVDGAATRAPLLLTVKAQPSSSPPPWVFLLPTSVELYAECPPALAGRGAAVRGELFKLSADAHARMAVIEGCSTAAAADDDGAASSTGVVRRAVALSADAEPDRPLSAYTYMCAPSTVAKGVADLDAGETLQVSEVTTDHLKR